MLGLRLDPETEASLVRMARREGRTKSEVVRNALREYLDRGEGDEALIGEVRAIAALTSEDELQRLDTLNEDLLELIEVEEAKLAADRAA